jgi:hypothetical protein
MPDRSNGRCQTKCGPKSSRLGVEHRVNDSALEKFTITKAWRRPKRTNRIVAPVKKKKKQKYICRQKSNDDFKIKNPVSLSS